MNKLVFILVFSSMLVLTGCASRRSGVIIDPAGVNMARYQQDLAQCQQIARQVGQKAGAGALGGAIMGGLVGAVVGNRRTVERAAGAGAVIGGARGLGATHRERQKVIKNCLRQRGYAVLN